MSIERLDIIIQKTLPLVYDDSLSYLEFLAKVVAKVNEAIEELNIYLNQDLQSYVEQKLIAWKDDGTLDNIISESILNIGDRQYTEQNYVTNGETVTSSLDALDVGVTTQLAEIVTSIDKLNTRKFLFVGDSWATSNSEFNTKSWVDYTIEKLGLTKGVTAFKANLGGTGVATSVITPHFGAVDFNRLIEVAQSFDASLASKDIITDIVICGGTNDHNKTSPDIVNGMVTIKNTIKRDYKNVRNIYIGFLGCWAGNYPNQHLIAQCFNYYSEGAAFIGATFISDAFKAMKLYLTNKPVLPPSSVSGWNFHPNDYGSELISRYISQKLIGGEYKHSVQNTLMNIALENEFSLFLPSGGNIPIYSYIEKDVVGVLVNSPFTLLNANSNSIFNLNGGKILIGSFTNSCLDPLANRNATINVTLSVTYTGERKTMPGALLFEEGKIYLITFTEPSTFIEQFYIEITQGYGTIDRYLC